MFRRGSDRLPRGSVKLLYRTLLDDDGTLAKSLKGDTSFRAQVMRSFLAAALKPRTAMIAIELIAVARHQKARELRPAAPQLGDAGRGLRWASATRRR